MTYQDPRRGSCEDDDEEDPGHAIRRRSMGRFEGSSFEGNNVERVVTDVCRERPFSLESVYELDWGSIGMPATATMGKKHVPLFSIPRRPTFQVAQVPRPRRCDPHPPSLFLVAVWATRHQVIWWT